MANRDEAAPVGGPGYAGALVSHTGHVRSMLGAVEVAETDVHRQLATHGYYVWGAWPEGEARGLAVLRALTQPDVIDLATVLDQELVIVRAVTRLTQIAAADGGMVVAPRTVLIDAGGQHYATMSTGILSSLADLTMFGLSGQMASGLRVVPKSARTRSGGTAFYLAVV